MATRQARLDSPRRKALLASSIRGLQFEHRATTLLSKYMNMSLRRIGGPNDGGVDLLGWWWVPELDNGDEDSNKVPASALGEPSGSASARASPVGESVKNRVSTVNEIKPTQIQCTRRLRILGQCKAEKRKVGPSYIREMEGVLASYYNMSDPQLEESNDVSHSRTDIRRRLDSYMSHLDHEIGKNPQTLKSGTNDAHVSKKADIGTKYSYPKIVPEAPTIGLLVSQSEFTKNAIARVQASKFPFMLIHLPPHHPADLAALHGKSVDVDMTAWNRGRNRTGSVNVTNLMDVEASREKGDAEAIYGPDAPTSIAHVIFNPSLNSRYGIFNRQMEIRWVRAMYPALSSASSSSDVSDSPRSSPSRSAQKPELPPPPININDPRNRELGYPMMWWRGKPVNIGEHLREGEDGIFNAELT